MSQIENATLEIFQKPMSESRTRILQYILTQSRLVLGYTALTASEELATINGWQFLIGDIPDKSLVDSYAIAMKIHKDGPFGVHHLRQGYEELQKIEAAERDRDRLYEERLNREIRVPIGKCPPDIKPIIKALFDRWEENLKRKSNDPKLPTLDITIPKIAPPPAICQSCYNSGWAIIQRTDPFTGLRGHASRPCECPEGDQYNRSFAAGN